MQIKKKKKKNGEAIYYDKSYAFILSSEKSFLSLETMDVVYAF